MSRSRPEPSFTDGPAISPSGPLFDRLNEAAQSAPTGLVRLPVVIRLDPMGFGVDAAEVGIDAETPADPAADGRTIHLTLNDGGMSVALSAQLEKYCGEEQDACAVWLEGHWGRPGEAFPQQGLDEPDGGLRVLFSPSRVLGPVEPGASSRETLAQIES